MLASTYEDHRRSVLDKVMDILKPTWSRLGGSTNLNDAKWYDWLFPVVGRWHWLLILARCASTLWFHYIVSKPTWLILFVYKKKLKKYIYNNKGSTVYGRMWVVHLDDGEFSFLLMGYLTLVEHPPCDFKTLPVTFDISALHQISISFFPRPLSHHYVIPFNPFSFFTF